MIKSNATHMDGFRKLLAKTDEMLANPVGHITGPCWYCDGGSDCHGDPTVGCPICIKDCGTVSYPLYTFEIRLHLGSKLLETVIATTEDQAKDKFFCVRNEFGYEIEERNADIDIDDISALMVPTAASGCETCGKELTPMEVKEYRQAANGADDNGHPRF